MDQKSNINVTVENYFAMWNARDARTRRTLVEEVWTEQARSDTRTKSRLSRDA